jgi:hypothetical protein
MPAPTEPKPEQNPTQAVEHVASAHQLLKELQQKVGHHPELGEAITKLEMALSTLAIKTGGML